MRIKLWGTRGSIPTPERRNTRYGGNTACVEVRLDNGTLIILDCGSGFRPLGNSLIREAGGGPIQGHIFFSHFHWDHIQGIPFFAPLFDERNYFAFHSIVRPGQDFQALIEGIMSGPYFPVRASAMTARRGFFDLEFGTIHINGAMITSAPLNHPQGCTGYRIEADGCVFVFATDTEHGSPEHDKAVRDLALGADVLVYDSQFTPQEMRTHRGWGHSTWLEGTRIAKDSDTQQLVLFHHDPEHDDAMMDEILQTAQTEFPNVLGGMEGMEFSLPRKEVGLAYPASALRHEPRYRAEFPVHVAWNDGQGRHLEADAVARDISKTGIYIVLPMEVRTEAPLEMEMVLPDEVTQQGPMKVRFKAQTIRSEKVLKPVRGQPRSVGIAALRLVNGRDPEKVRHASHVA